MEIKRTETHVALSLWRDMCQVVASDSDRWGDIKQPLFSQGIAINLGAGLWFELLRDMFVACGNGWG